MVLFLEKWLAFGHGATSQWMLCEGTTTHKSSIKAQNVEATQGKTAGYSAVIKRAIESYVFVGDQDRRRGSHASCKLGTHSV